MPIPIPAAFAALTLCAAGLQAEELKFPHITVKRQPANYSFFQKRVSSDSFHLRPGEPIWEEMNFRSCDLSAYDLKNNGDMLYATFDSKTKFPAEMPKAFDRARIEELGRNPGLGVRKLHEAGITGSGVGIAIIDQALLPDHAEYADRLRFYEEIHMIFNETSMHAPAVASIAAGKTTGVAPEAGIYFIGQINGYNEKSGGFVMDAQPIADSLDRLVEVNRLLPKEHKIRAASISLGIGPRMKHYDEFMAALGRAEKNGIFVIHIGRDGYLFSGLGRPPLSDPDSPQSYTAGGFYGRDPDFDKSLWLPMDSRAVAAPTGKQDYAFYRFGGLSWTAPWVAGLYALACQTNPDITPKVFWEAALATADRMKLHPAIGPDAESREPQYVVNPGKLIAAIKAMNKPNHK